MSWRDCTGRGVSVAVVDSGIHAGHPHVPTIAGGVSVAADGGVTADACDRIGHGTAVAAAIREKAPAASLYAVRVFDRTLATTAGRIVRALRWSADQGVDVVNLSLGTQRGDHADAFGEAVEYAARRRTIFVAAAESEGVEWLPGSLPGVIAVRVDYDCPRDEFRVRQDSMVVASGYPRPIPGVPPERNLRGVSFAVANVTGFVARVRERFPKASADEVVEALRAPR